MLGPFANVTRYRLECAAGQLSWDIAPSDFPSVGTNGPDRMVTLAQSDYDALSPPDESTLYLIVG